MQNHGGNALGLHTSTHAFQYRRPSGGSAARSACRSSSRSQRSLRSCFVLAQPLLARVVPRLGTACDALARLGRPVDVFALVPDAPLERERRAELDAEVAPFS